MMNQATFSPYVFLPQTFKKLLLPFVERLSNNGISYLSYGIKRNGIRTCFFSHSNWGKNFINQQFYTSDPYTIRAETTSSKFIFWEDIEFDKNEKEIDYLRKNECKIVNGMTFSTYAYDFHELIAVGTSSPLLSMKALALEKNRNKNLFETLAPIRKVHLNYIYAGNHEK